MVEERLKDGELASAIFQELGYLIQVTRGPKKIGDIVNHPYIHPVLGRAAIKSRIIGTATQEEFQKQKDLIFRLTGYSLKVPPGKVPYKVEALD